MAKYNEVDAPAAAAEKSPTVETVETSNRPRRGLALAGVIGGGVVAAALLFGGGVLVGTVLPGGPGGHPGFSLGELHAGPPPGGQQPPPQQQGPQRGGVQPPQQNNDGN